MRCVLRSRRKIDAGCSLLGARKPLGSKHLLPGAKYGWMSGCSIPSTAASATEDGKGGAVLSDASAGLSIPHFPDAAHDWDGWDTHCFTSDLLNTARLDPSCPLEQAIAEADHILHGALDRRGFTGSSAAETEEDSEEEEDPVESGLYAGAHLELGVGHETASEGSDENPVESGAFAGVDVDMAVVEAAGVDIAVEKEEETEAVSSKTQEVEDVSEKGVAVEEQVREAVGVGAEEAMSIVEEVVRVEERRVWPPRPWWVPAAAAAVQDDVVEEADEVEAGNVETNVGHQGVEGEKSEDSMATAHAVVVDEAEVFGGTEREPDSKKNEEEEEVDFSPADAEEEEEEGAMEVTCDSAKSGAFRLASLAAVVEEEGEKVGVGGGSDGERATKEVVSHAAFVDEVEAVSDMVENASEGRVESGEVVSHAIVFDDDEEEEEEEVMVTREEKHEEAALVVNSIVSFTVVTEMVEATLPVSSERMVEFRVKKEVPFGSSIKVVGCHDSLGGWQPERAVTMQWQDGHVWSAQVPIDASNCEFKFVVASECGEHLYWEALPDNRRLQVPHQASMVVAEADFECPKGVRVVTDSEASLPSMVAAAC